VGQVYNREIPTRLKKFLKGGKMSKELIYGICITAFVAIAAWAPNVLAYDSNRNCTNCHNWFNSSHDNHQNRNISCSTCHNKTVSASCATCHEPTPLQSNHINNYGVSTCAGCHPQSPPPPVAETNCSDGVDNNDNGLTDCADSDCDGAQFDVTTCGEGECAATGNLECRNEGLFDTCQEGNPQAEGPFGDASCSDSVDNDCDGATDASDSDCAAPPETCDDGVDNNDNGLVDCADPQCDGEIIDAVTSCGIGACQSTGSLICQNNGVFDTCDPLTPGAEGPFGDASCSDGVDNDCDGNTDVNDTDCAAPPEVCDDGVDNNGNGLIDCADPQCDGETIGAITCGVGACESTGSIVCQGLSEVNTCQPGAPGNEGPDGDASCSDGVDNNCNNQIDAADANCQPDAVPEICDDGIDNNGNGQVDCADPLCDGFVGQPGSCTTSLPGICAAGTLSCDQGETFCDPDNQAVTEGPSTSPTCNDTLDNDCDGSTDANDSDCYAPSTPEPFCGDGNIDAGEQCDDGNNVDGDGCSSTCQTETTPPPPAPFCGDGNVDVGEQCDDGNTVSGDGCENDCTVSLTTTNDDHDSYDDDDVEYNRSGDRESKRRNYYHRRERIERGRYHREID
jgi:cysteine-rich repeat protein